MANTLFVVYASHTNILPSCDADTKCRLSHAHCIAYILAKCPFSVRRTLIVNRWILSICCAFSFTGFLKSQKHIRFISGHKIFSFQTLTRRIGQRIMSCPNLLLELFSFSPRCSHPLKDICIMVTAHIERATVKFVPVTILLSIER